MKRLACASLCPGPEACYNRAAPSLSSLVFAIHSHRTLMTANSFDPATQMQQLQAGARTLGVDLSPTQLEQFERYYQALVQWNRKFNLTAITDYEEVQAKHFLDSLAGAPILAEELGITLPMKRSLHLVDVGTGAGFPGVPLKIAEQKMKLTLMDGTGKKIRFLQQLIDELDLANAGTVQGRAEELGRQPAYRGQFDVVTARAVAPLNTLVEYLLPLVRREGYALIYKGPGAPEEFVAARKAIEILGGETARIAPVEIPFVEGRRFIVLIKKVRRTPDLYPRGQGLARKQPIR